MYDLWERARLGPMELKNRTVRSATNEHLSEPDGRLTQVWADTLIQLAENQLGLVMTGHLTVDGTQRADEGQPVLDQRADPALLRQAADGVHAAGGRLVAQLSHSGLKAPAQVNGQPPKGPADFTEADMDRLVDQFVYAARLCQQAGAELYVAPPVREGEQKVSSTRIRAAVEAGDIPLANRLLGRPFGFSLEVIHGNHIGTGLGTPTINQAIPEGFVLPKFGVYASWCRVGGEYFYGVTNVGVKPTVGSDRVLAETWMPDFQGDLYGKRVRVFLLEFLRPERKFHSLDELKSAIRENGEQAKAVTSRISPPYFPQTTLQEAKSVIK